MSDERKTGPTPGPWVIHETGEWVWAPAFNRVVADAPVSGRVDAEDEANLHLIAAAPEMAAALALLLTGPYRDFDAVEAGRAALKKAGLLQ